MADKSDNDRDVPHDYIELQAPLTARHIRLENLHMPSGQFALSGLRIFGTDPAAKVPEAVKGFKAVRDKADPRNAMLTWRPADNAYGYNIYYVHTNALTLTAVRWASSPVRLSGP